MIYYLRGVFLAGRYSYPIYVYSDYADTGIYTHYLGWWEISADMKRLKLLEPAIQGYSAKPELLDQLRLLIKEFR